MADNSGIIKIGAVAVAAYVAYTQGWLSFLGIGTAAATTASAASTSTSGTSTGTSTSGSSTGTPPAAPPAPNPKANVLDGIYTAMVKAANAPSAGLTVDQWGYYLNQQLGALNLQAPDPVPMFTAMVNAANAALALNNLPGQGGMLMPAFDRATYLVTAPAYWAVMAPALQTQLGLSGLGIYGGLGALMRRYA